MARCYRCGKTVRDEDATMLNVVLGGGRSYVRTGRRLFHKACAEQALVECRRTALIILLATIGIALVSGLGLVITAIILVRDDLVIVAGWVPLLIIVVGGLLALGSLFNYTR